MVTTLDPVQLDLAEDQLTRLLSGAKALFMMVERQDDLR